MAASTITHTTLRGTTGLVPGALYENVSTGGWSIREQAVVGRSLEGMNATRLPRRSTIRSADHIIVLEAGRIVQQGSVDALVGAQGPFLRRVRRQRR